VTAYDRPGWSGRFRGRARVHTPDGRRVMVRFEEVERANYFGDQFMGRHSDTWLVSDDGGRGWERLAGAGPVTEGVVLSDGTRLVVDHTCATRRGDALRTYLEEQGAGHLWHPDAFAWWDVAGLERRKELEGQGLFVRESGKAGERFLAYLRDMSVGTLAPGETEWRWRPLEGLPRMSHLAGWWRQRGVRLDDNTIVGCITGKVEADEPQNSAFALRTGDGGKSWELVPIARIRGDLGFNETFLHALPDGRILALIRTTAPDNHLYRSVSEDGGRTWSEPERTPIWGFPAHIIELRQSEALLCTYAHRRHPFGVRAALSRDGGVTWDVASEKILRDDSVGVAGYPTSVEMEDGTIFTAYELGKRGDENPGERPHSYIAVSRYTVDYVAPLGRR
jgi:hypothetical protein